MDTVTKGVTVKLNPLRCAKAPVRSRAPQHPCKQLVTSGNFSSGPNFGTLKHYATRFMKLLTPSIPTSQPSTPQQAVLRVFEGEFLIDDENSTREQAADNTCRPNKPPVEARGVEFYPLQAPHCEPSIQPLPSSALALFQHFIPESLVEKWVKYTNEALRPGCYGPPQKRSRKNTWKPTTTAEIYVWLAILIYIGIHKE